MKYIADKSALKYLFDDFPRKYDKKTWDKFTEMLKIGEIFSERETLKQLKQDIVDADSINWLDKNKKSFNPLDEKGAKVLRELMTSHVFDFIINSPQIIQRRAPEGLPFVIAMAKAYRTEVLLVYRRNCPFDKHIISICKKEKIQCLEVEEMLMQIRSVD